MKYKTMISLLLAAALLASCSTEPTKTSDETTAEATSEETEAEETTEETTVETTEETTAETEPEKKGQPAAFWYDDNINFGHDEDDLYVIDGEKVSMKAYYDAIEADPNLQAYYAYNLLFSKDYISDALFYENEENTVQEDCDLVKMKEIVLDPDSGDDGTEIIGTVPQLTLDSADAQKVNQEMIDAMIADDGWYLGGTFNSRYKVIEREDGSMTLVLCYRVYEFTRIRAFNFDANGKLMSNDDVIKSAGFDKDEFMSLAEKKLTKDTENADVFFEVFGGLNMKTTFDSFKNDPELFINENGDIVLLLDMSGGPGTPLYGMLPYPVELDIETSDKISSAEVLDGLEYYTISYKDMYEYLSTGYNSKQQTPTGKTTKIDEIDVETVPENINSSVEYEDGTSHVRLFTWYSVYMTGYGVPGYDVRVTLPEICRESSTYKYELYSNGKVIDSGSVEKIADPFYKSIEFHFDLKNDGDYLFVFYDKDSDEDVLAYGWFHYAEADYADMMPEG